MKLYKLTNKDGQTYNKTQWGENITHTASGEGSLCSSGFLHAYTSPLLAVLLNPIHANFNSSTMLLWEAQGIVVKKDNGLKVGCTKLTTVKQIPIPTITIEQKIRFGILCSIKVHKEESFLLWAKNWLNGKDRTLAATSAAYAAKAAAYAANAVNAAANAATYAAKDAANAAVNAANAVNAAVHAANAAVNATYATHAAEDANIKIDYCSIARQAMRGK